ncbi:hypothetical protein PHSY_004891 [Pseudozyma hubeiensis SY62]|uniref:Uncharacterized protein n=1 Tax=Pseudozyma hubeiensis (strain SY62) TaxID=1305764 RepID=R9P7H8_PSEHS|nr:hypothetical protein PHSY_004891 [Pseudozyma hubeiensis SY62]GAC97306.1 hypothetical protein PHSY_004891 [Pseudozyma hubeiensis SY62]
MISSGRGGAGNVRSPSRDPLDRKKAAEAQAREDKLQEEYRSHDSKVAHSTGRGGAGNIATTGDAEERGRGRDSNGTSGGGGVAGLLRSLSRSRSREPRGNGKDSPKNRSQSRPRASESSKLAQVDETSRSSEEETAYSASTHKGPNGGV